MSTGTVKWFSKERGYGFIAPDEGDKDVFVHITELEKSGVYQLDEGQKVSFDVSEQRGRESASDIKVIEE